ncbi:hypothetical protein DM01DRAFT_1340599 [Hesseltinella vesiculosa]|uniref:Uncharacterized protein n=1 Tax=Hesseltinella vesiculosa TaxID=101127 RepID=A0A1X2G3H6_9FUNG|nr:hypothetical protein DM01DRAFT_1340599 [Hesseltinella vesiculosa]
MESNRLHEECLSNIAAASSSAAAIPAFPDAAPAAVPAFPDAAPAAVPAFPDAALAVPAVSDAAPALPVVAGSPSTAPAPGPSTGPQRTKISENETRATNDDVPKNKTKKTSLSLSPS